MTNSIFQKFLDIHIADDGLFILTQGCTEQEIEQDILLLQQCCREMPLDIPLLASRFFSRLWTLLGEIAVPEQLGACMPTCWPVLIFPCGIPYRSYVEDFIFSAGMYIQRQQECPITPMLHASLYAGQSWYPALLSAFKESIRQTGRQGVVLWIEPSSNATSSLASVARKLQVQLRPRLPEWKTSLPGSIYTGIQRTFHTPRLENVAIHSFILQQAE